MQEDKTDSSEFLLKKDKSKGGDSMFLDEFVMNKKNLFEEWER